MNIDLSGMNILVTGASGGIGKAIAHGLAVSGATVAVHYNHNAEGANALVHELGHGAQSFQADLSVPEECSRLFSDVLEKFNTLDVLVNNAGIIISSPLDTPVDRWLEDWDKTLMVNITSVGILCHAAINHFIDHGGGRIINITSRAAFRGDTPEFLAYTASKGGMVSLSRTIARGYGKQNIKSFIVAPGFVRTEMAQPHIDKYGESFITDDLALDRLTEPDDVASTVVFLASGFMDHATGCTIDINAGSYVH